MSDVTNTPEISRGKKLKESKKAISKSDIGFNRFMKVASTSDLVAMVLKTHLLAEYYIDQIIIMSIPRGDLITSARFTFSNKLLILKSLQILDNSDIDALHGLNSLRNDCSHVLNYKICEKDVDILGKPYGLNHIELKDKYPTDMKRLLNLSLMRIIAHMDAYHERLLIRMKKTKSTKE
jgi:hypothetical protein